MRFTEKLKHKYTLSNTGAKAMIRAIRVIRVQTLSLAALHTEGAEDGSEV